MPLRIICKTNTLKNVPGKYLICSRSAGLIDEDELEKRMAEDNTTLTIGDAALAMRVMRQVIVKLVSEGYKVKTPLGTFYLSASGYADSDMEEFLPGRGNKKHRLTLRTFRSKKLEAEIIKEAKWQHVELFENKYPVIQSVRSIQGAEISSVRRGEMIHVTGRRLLFDETVPTQGIFFKPETGAAVRADYYACIRNSLVIPMVPPQLSEGIYSVILVTHPVQRKEEQRSTLKCALKITF